MNLALIRAGGANLRRAIFIKSTSIAGRSSNQSQLENMRFGFAMAQTTSRVRRSRWRWQLMA
jgi:hypothetical protein